jgi:glutamate racemase
MKIGIFDSGLGGLAMLHALREAFPTYDYVFYGDTLRVPYGDKTTKEIQRLTQMGLNFLFANDCELVILACNTASATVLRELQETYLPRQNNSHLRILGVIVPTAEVLTGYKHIGILATTATVTARSFDKSFARYGWHGTITYQSAPKLVPLIEQGLYDEALEVIQKEYLPAILEKNVEALILGCTHYMLLKNRIRNILPEQIKLISQDEVIPQKLKTYLDKHIDTKKRISKNGNVDLFVTKATDQMNTLGQAWFGVLPEILK